MGMMTMMLAVSAAADPNFDSEFLVIGGGGDWGATVSHSSNPNARGNGGGGAGGYISSVSGESSGGGASALAAAKLATGVAYSVTVGAAGSNTIFSGTDTDGSAFNHTALAGGSANGSGGSGGGASINGSAGSGTTGQGFNGSEDVYPTGGNASVCSSPRFYCYTDPDSATFCTSGAAGAGGGAGGAASGKNGGVGVQSSITGSATYYAGGGAGETACGNISFSQGTAGSGASSYGGGGSYAGTGQPGVVILSYPSEKAISNPGGGLTLSTSTVGVKKVTTITAGTGNIQFS